MKEKLLTKIKEKDAEQLAFLVLLLFLIVYYVWRMFALVPWYDELYTYYYFISKGPIYAAIHWPVPNNHVGYSTISAILNYLGNSYIGLRGIAFISSIWSVLLMFRIGRIYLKQGLSLCACLIYVSFDLVNQLAVQGRGYSFVTMCLLLGLYAFLHIEGSIVSDKKQRWYLVWSFSLFFGLWAIPSSVYWVIPICLICGMALLLEREDRSLIRLVLWSLAAAVMTFAAYAVLWVAIGSNLITKDPNHVLFGISHVSIILHHPVMAIKAGIDYMLATPYIQSVSKEGYLGALWTWIQMLFQSYDNKLAIALIACAVIGMLMCVWMFWLERKQKHDKELFWYLLLFGMTLWIPLILFVQKKLPYFRVFSFYGVFLAWIVVWILQIFLLHNAEKRFIIVLSVLLFCNTAFYFLGSDANRCYGDRERCIEDAYKQLDLSERSSICVTDCDQEYLLLFLYGIRCEERELQNADIVLLDHNIVDPDGEWTWEFYLSSDTLDRDELAKFDQIYENEMYYLYTRRKP